MSAAKRCSNPACFVHEGESCPLGHLNHTDCESWRDSTSADKDEVSEHVVETARVPWSGSALGLTDLANLTPRGRTILIGVLGAHDSGKTTLLTGSYLQLLQGSTFGDAKFVGSRTLGAWESLAAWVRLDDSARLPSFPPHTPRGTGRAPGLLHLALRNEKGECRDVLFTDAPGEWFSRWAVKEDAPEAAGARWIVENADAFLVFADCGRLSGASRGQARDDLRQLIDRLANHVAHRPVKLVWAKDDLNPKEEIREAIRRSLKMRIKQAVEVGASASRPESLIAAIRGLLEVVWTPEMAKPINEPVLQHQPFAAFRGTYAHS